MADATYQPAVYRKQGGSELVVASGGAITVESGGYIDYDDSGTLRLGTGNDATFTWDGNNLILTAAADDTLWEIGDSAVTQKSFDLKWYANEASGASYLYFDASGNNIYTTGVDLQIKDDDYLTFGTGAGAAGDVQIEWDTTGTDALRITCAADDTLIEIGNGTNSFDINLYGSQAANVQSFDASADKWVWGTTSAHIASATASIIFDDRVHECSATSGSAYGFKQRMYVTGAAGSGAAGRFYSFSKGAAAANVYGAEITAELHADANSDITGQMCAIRAVADVNRATSGTISVLNLTMDYASAVTSHANSAFIAVQNAGDGTDIGNLIYIGDAAGSTSATTLVSTVKTAATNWSHGIRCTLSDGTPIWIMATTTTPAA